MSYLVEIFSDDRRSDWQLIEEKTFAEDRYFRALALVTQNLPVRTEDGRLVYLLGCFLYEVPTKQMSVAKTMVQENDARRVHSSDDPLCGDVIGLEGLFKIVH
jgi:hypothetical protein